MLFFTHKVKKLTKNLQCRGLYPSKSAYLWKKFQNLRNFCRTVQKLSSTRVKSIRFTCILLKMLTKIHNFLEKLTKLVHLSCKIEQTLIKIARNCLIYS